MVRPFYGFAGPLPDAVGSSWGRRWGGVRFASRNSRNPRGGKRDELHFPVYVHTYTYKYLGWDRGTRYATVTGPLRRPLRWKKRASGSGALAGGLRLPPGVLKGHLSLRKGARRGQNEGPAGARRSGLMGSLEEAAGPRKVWFAYA